jgi:hypothetical protein
MFLHIISKNQVPTMTLSYRSPCAKKGPFFVQKLKQLKGGLGEKNCSRSGDCFWLTFYLHNFYYYFTSQGFLVFNKHADRKLADLISLSVCPSVCLCTKKKKKKKKIPSQLMISLEQLRPRPVARPNDLQANLWLASLHFF